MEQRLEVQSGPLDKKPTGLIDHISSLRDLVPLYIYSAGILNSEELAEQVKLSDPYQAFMGRLSSPMIRSQILALMEYSWNEVGVSVKREQVETFINKILKEGTATVIRADETLEQLVLDEIRRLYPSQKIESKKDIDPQVWNIYIY